MANRNGEMATEEQQQNGETRHNLTPDRRPVTETSIYVCMCQILELFAVMS